ncbi:hypothetical protein MMC17_008599 [Xylographa soralifera]|nr:hypothetical protein [Xylographa soralifera]
MAECPYRVRHLSIPEDTMIVRDTARWIITKTMELHLEEKISIPGYRLIPVEKIGHTWKETIWISRSEHTVDGCLINDPTNEIDSFYEISFKLKNWKKLELRGCFDGSTKLYQVQYILDIQKQGPALKWKITIPKYGEFRAKNSEHWAAEVATGENHIFHGDIISHQPYGQAFPLASTAMTYAARDIA